MLDRALAIAKKDMKEYFTSKALVIAVFILPIMVALTVPSIVGLFLENVPSTLNLGETRFMPPVLRDAVETLGARDGLYWYLYTVVTLPLFLLLPTASVIVLASDSFAGEKERRTAEGLVAEPVSMEIIFIGKTLAPVLIAIISTWVSAAIYWVLVSKVSGDAGVQLAPNEAWFSALLFVVPALSLANVAAISWISSLSKGFKESQQIAGVLIVPLVAIVFSSASGNFTPTLLFNLRLAVAYLAAFVIGVLLWARIVEPRRLVE